ncbi:MAG: hypothetical protein R3D62_01305 [Xanthobacteraceae bacterium]
MEGDDEVRVRRTTIILFPLAVVLAAFFPIANVYIYGGASLFDTQAEFVTYRVSDALTVHFGQAEHVHPVQGIPTALISKYVTLVLFWVYDTALVTRPILLIYGYAVFATLAIILGIGVALTNRVMTWPERITLLVFIMYPWVVCGPAIGLLLAPDYWIGEFVFLACIFGFVAWLRSGASSFAADAGAIGTITALGMMLKVTLAPIGLLLFAIAFAKKKPASLRRGVINAAIAFVATYFLFSVLYMGGDFRAALAMIRFQISFYARPNASHVYDDFGSLLTQNPSVVVFSAMIIVLGADVARQRAWLAAAAVIWIGILWFLVANRRHDTSVTSASLSMLFVIAVLVTEKAGRFHVPIALGGLSLASAINPQWNYKVWFTPVYQERYERPDADFATALELEIARAKLPILYIPGNDWNAALLQQAFGYNGELANTNTWTQYGYTGPAYRYFFGNVRLVGVYPPGLGLGALKAAAGHGATVVWTRNLNSTARHTDVAPILLEQGCALSRTNARFHGGRWEVTIATCSGAS